LTNFRLGKYASLVQQSQPVEFKQSNAKLTVKRHPQTAGRDTYHVVLRGCSSCFVFVWAVRCNGKWHRQDNHSGKEHRQWC